MSGTLLIRNRQRARKPDLRRLSRICHTLLRDELGRDNYELGVFLLGDQAMERANRQYLNHEGTTDVITFDYGEGAASEVLTGDIFVCVPVAIRQAQEFCATWQEEVVRYIVHGILHLLGYDDHDTPQRRRMRREEARLLKRLAVRFDLKQIARR